eukprot:Em0001g1639a
MDNTSQLVGNVMDTLSAAMEVMKLIAIALQTKSDAQTDNAYHQVGFVMVTPIAPMAPMEVLSLIAIVRQTNSDVVMDNASLQVHSVMAILNVLMEVTKFVAIALQTKSDAQTDHASHQTGFVASITAPLAPMELVLLIAPSSLHFASLALCFLPSLARAADPEDTPASIKSTEGQQDGCGYDQLWGHCQLPLGCQDGPGPVACFSQNIMKGVVSYHHITATLTSGGMMSQRIKALPGQSAHWDPWEVSIPSHHLWQLHGPVHQDVPSPCDGRTDSQNDACGAETESNCAWSALEEVSDSRLNMQVSNVLDSSFGRPETLREGSEFAVPCQVEQQN